VLVKIDLGPEVDGPTGGKRHGVFRYSCVAYPSVQGFSRQPLLDACRQLKSLYGLTAPHQVALYREGRDTPDLSCPIDTRFKKYKPFKLGIFKEEHVDASPLEHAHAD
jgi:hypothetical protein